MAVIDCEESSDITFVAHLTFTFRVKVDFRFFSTLTAGYEVSFNEVWFQIFFTSIIDYKVGWLQESASAR
jgi:hypothetical protein